MAGGGPGAKAESLFRAGVQIQRASLRGWLAAFLEMAGHWCGVVPGDGTERVASGCLRGSLP
jgi:hypothetical protein